jgi:lysophospholipase
MTVESALAKMAYLIGKGYSSQQMVKLIQSNMRGELTQGKEKLPFQLKELGAMQIVKGVLNECFPSTMKDILSHKVDNNVAKYVIGKCSPEEFKVLFYHSNLSEKENQKLVLKSTKDFSLLHKAVDENNLEMAVFLVSIGADVNEEDKYKHSPQFYALKNRNKSIIQMLRKHGGRVVCPIFDMFQIFVEALKIDDTEFFNLMAHLEFKKTLRNLKNS